MLYHTGTVSEIHERAFLSIIFQNYNVVDYDEELLDGFYDLYSYPAPDTIVNDQLPSLLELQTLPISQSTDVEVVLVDRLLDPTLQKLVKEAKGIFSKYKLDCSMLVQEIARLVVDAMGGTVENAEEMQLRWDQKRYELCVFLKSLVIPLGLISIGLSRHRALLFKVCLFNFYFSNFLLLSFSYWSSLVVYFWQLSNFKTVLGCSLLWSCKST